MSKRADLSTIEKVERSMARNFKLLSELRADSMLTGSKLLPIFFKRAIVGINDCTESLQAAKQLIKNINDE